MPEQAMDKKAIQSIKYLAQQQHKQVEFDQLILALNHKQYFCLLLEQEKKYFDKSNYNNVGQ